MTNKSSELDKADLLEQQAKKFQKELNSGTVALMLLSVIGQSSSPMYGYEIAKALQKGNDGKQGTIYPVLRNLNSKGLLDCEVKLSESGPPRKYFTISPLGKSVLEQWTATWRATQAQVDSILGLSKDNE